MSTINKALTETNLIYLEKLLTDNNWSLIVGEGINDGLYCDGLKSIAIQYTGDKFVLSVLFNDKLLKKYFELEDVLSDALLIYFISEYHDQV